MRIETTRMVWHHLLTILQSQCRANCKGMIGCGECKGASTDTERFFHKKNTPIQENVYSPRFPFYIASMGHDNKRHRQSVGAGFDLRISVFSHVELHLRQLFRRRSASFPALPLLLLLPPFAAEGNEALLASAFVAVIPLAHRVDRPVTLLLRQTAADAPIYLSIEAIPYSSFMIGMERKAWCLEYQLKES